MQGGGVFWRLVNGSYEFFFNIVWHMRFSYFCYISTSRRGNRWFSLVSTVNVSQRCLFCIFTKRKFQACGLYRIEFAIVLDEVPSMKLLTIRRFLFMYSVEVVVFLISILLDLSRYIVGRVVVYTYAESCGKASILLSLSLSFYTTLAFPLPAGRIIVFVFYYSFCRGSFFVVGMFSVFSHIFVNFSYCGLYVTYDFVCSHSVWSNRVK